MTFREYLPWMIAIAALSWIAYSYTREEDEDDEDITSGEESIEAIDRAISRMR